MDCPGAPQLESLLRSEVTPQQEAELCAHLEDCAGCRQRLETLTGGEDLVRGRRPEADVPTSTPEPALARAIDQLRRLQPWPHGERRAGAATAGPEAATVRDTQDALEPLTPTRKISPAASLGRNASAGPRLKTPWWQSWRAGSALCVLLGGFWLLLDREPLDLKLTALSYDLPLRWRGPIRPTEVLIVSMDAELQRQLNPKNTNEWSRALHASMLRRAMALGAELVVFDITFARPREDAAADQAFAEALQEASGKVVLGVKLEKRQEADVLLSIPRLPIAAFASVSAWGLVNVDTNRDGRVRQHYVDSDAQYPSLAWKAVDLLGKAPAEPSRPRWMNYYGPRRTLPFIPYDRFLQQPMGESNSLAGRILFVGSNPLQPGDDEHPTSFTREASERVSGVEIHATAFLNLLRREWLEEVPWPLQGVLVLSFGVGLPLLFRRLRPGWAVLGGLAGFLALLLGSCLLAWIKYRWFPWLVIGAVQMPCALLWSVLARSRRDNATMPQRVTAATSEDPAPAPAPARVEPRRLPEIPDHIPLRCVGRGAYGEVWLARDVIGSFHAVKVVYRNTFTRDEPFEREFRGMQKFTPISRLHPGWVNILHVGRNPAQGYFFYIMELGDDEMSGQQIDPERYVPKTLTGELQKRGRLPLEECLTLGVALADALEHLHRHALIHRDIKPSNVIYVRGAPKFTDIGLVTDVNSRREISWIGTEGFMAPEGPGTPAADVFGLGKLLYEVATGWDREAFPKLPTPLSAQTPTTEWQQFHRILLKACEEDPAQRYSSASDFQRDLLQMMNQITKRATRMG